MESIALADLIGYAAAALGACMFAPQALAVWKTKRTKDISLASYILVAAATLLWIIYGFMIQAMPVFIVNIIIEILSLYIIFMKLKYK